MNKLVKNRWFYGLLIDDFIFYFYFFDINACFHEQTYVGHYLCMIIYFKILRKMLVCQNRFFDFFETCSYES
jgi:hypothetical protein